MEGIFIGNFSICVFLFVHRYMFLIKDKIGFVEEQIAFLNEQSKYGQPLSLEKFRTKLHFSRPYKLVYKEHMVYPNYKKVVSKYNDLQLKKQRFWKIEGKIYIIGIIMGVLGPVLLKFIPLVHI